MIRDAQDAKEYLQRHIRESTLIRTPEYYKRHSYDTGEITKGKAYAIRANCSGLDVDPNELEIAGILHDLGKCLTTDLAHETIIASDYLVAEGMPRIAATIRTHFTVKEILQIEKERGNAYMDLDPEDFTPMTWNEVILAYGDLHNDGRGPVTFEARIAELFERHTDELFFESIRRGESRLRQIRDDVDSLASGECPELMEKYGFL